MFAVRIIINYCVMLCKLHLDEKAITEYKNICEQNKIKFIQPIILSEDGFFREIDKYYFVETKNTKYDDEFRIFANKQVKYAKEHNCDIFDLFKEHKELFKCEYGVADNIEQIREYFKEEIEDESETYAISLQLVEQNKENSGKTGGWRWCKWGPYIGKYDIQCEYLDDEVFGDDFQGYVLCYHLIKTRI